MDMPSKKQADASRPASLHHKVHGLGSGSKRNPGSPKHSHLETSTHFAVLQHLPTVKVGQARATGRGAVVRRLRLFPVSLDIPMQPPTWAPASQRVGPMRQTVGSSTNSFALSPGCSGPSTPSFVLVWQQRRRQLGLQQPPPPSPLPPAWPPACSLGASAVTHRPTRGPSGSPQAKCGVEATTDASGALNDGRRWSC